MKGPSGAGKSSLLNILGLMDHDWQGDYSLDGVAVAKLNHKQRQDLTGAVNVGDAPLYGGVASIKGADSVLADAEARAARLWGADWCRFSVAGSTHGNQALALALGSPGQEVIVTRILHRSLLLGLVLAGLRPVWVRPEVQP